MGAFEERHPSPMAVPAAGSAPFRKHKAGAREGMDVPARQSKKKGEKMWEERAKVVGGHDQRWEDGRLFGAVATCEVHGHDVPQGGYGGRDRCELVLVEAQNHQIGQGWRELRLRKRYRQSTVIFLLVISRQQANMSRCDGGRRRGCDLEVGDT